MPNPKVGTVTRMWPGVRNAQAGQVTYRVDTAGIGPLHHRQGEFRSAGAEGKLAALIADLQRPTRVVQGQYLKRVALSSTWDGRGGGSGNAVLATRTGSRLCAIPVKVARSA